MCIHYKISAYTVFSMCAHIKALPVLCVCNRRESGGERMAVEERISGWKSGGVGEWVWGHKFNPTHILSKFI